MSSKIGLLIAVFFLAACAAPPARSRDAAAPAARTPDAAPAPEPAPAPKSVDAGVERSCRASLPVCIDAALKVCRDRDYQVLRQERSGDQSASICAAGRSTEFSLAFTRAPDNRTRLCLRVRGRALQENRDEAACLIDKLCEALLEPRD